MIEDKNKSKIESIPSKLSILKFSLVSMDRFANFSRGNIGKIHNRKNKIPYYGEISACF